MELYLYQNGEQTGPFTKDEISSMILKGELVPQDIIWHEGLSEWQPVNSLLDFPETVAPVNVFRIPDQEVFSKQEVLSKQEVVSEPLEAKPKANHGLIALGWGFICIGTILIFWSLPQYFIYGPLFLIAFILGVVAMLRRRTTAAITLWLWALISPVILWLAFSTILSDYLPLSDDLTKLPEGLPIIGTGTDSSELEVKSQPADGSEEVYGDPDLKALSELRNRKAEFEKKLQAMSGFKILSAKFTNEKNTSGINVPLMTIKVLNDTNHRVARVSFRAALSSSGRDQPIIEDTFNYRIKKGSEPGKETDLQLKLNVFGDWGKIEASSDMKLDIMVIGLTGANNEELFGDVVFSAEDEQRLAELEKIVNDKK